MQILDIVVRGIFIPCIWLFIFYTVPEFKENLRDWTLLFADGSKRKVKRRKTDKVTPRAMGTYSNSFPKYLRYSDDFIITHK